MWSTEGSVEVAASPDTIWRIWTEVDRWPEWDGIVVDARLDGPFEVGSRILLRTRGAPRRAIRLVEVTPGARYRSEDRMPLARLEFDHRVSAGTSGSRIVYTQSISGPLSAVLGRLFGAKMAATLPGRLESLRGRAERLEGGVSA